MLAPISKPEVIARVLSGEELECLISIDGAELLRLSGQVEDVAPDVKGADGLASNKALLHNAWAYSKFTFQKVNLPTDEEQKAASRRAEDQRKVAQWLAELAASPGNVTRNGWCSSCFTLTDHRSTAGSASTFVCTSCGSPTSVCAAPRCESLAVLQRGLVRLPRYCAEHRHEIPGFEKSQERVDDLADYAELHEYVKPNLSRVGKTAGIGLMAVTLTAPAALLAAPAVGGAIGSLIGGYSGAVATNYGLALLGGGSLAAGGLGMAGGTLVVTAAGAALGGTLGASIANTYLREDKSFFIEELRDGDGMPVIVCNGFLSEGMTGWGPWKSIVSTRYPDSPVYRVRWGAKELKDLGGLVGGGAVKLGLGRALKKGAARAAQVAAKKVGPIGPALLVTDLTKNPWFQAKSRADKTGVVVADLLARTTAGSYVLIGHSLGARVMVVAAQTLASKENGPRLEDVHLTGAAIGSKSDWSSLTGAVDGTVYNYFSKNDGILKLAYPIGMAGQGAAGRHGFQPAPQGLENIDVSGEVKSHDEYYTNVTLR